jgi:hypothetical protein
MDARGTIGEVERRGDGLAICCRRTHVGLKSADTCRTYRALDVPTLVALYGPETAVDRLEQQLHCPGCGTRQIALEVVRRPAIVRSTVNLTTLGQAPEVVFAFCCTTCPRRGRYHKESLLRMVGADALLKVIPLKVAAGRGCPLAAGEGSLRCGARYDIAAMYLGNGRETR